MSINKPKAERPRKSNRKSSGSSSKYKSIFAQNQVEDQDVDFSQVEAESVKAAIHAVISDGDAISFSLTSDGGALAVTVLSGGERHKAYAHKISEIEDLLEALAQG